MVWKIEESVGGGMYITLEGIFTTKAGAEAEIARLPSNEHMRAAAYERAMRNGLTRCEPQPEEAS